MVEDWKAGRSEGGKEVEREEEENEGRNARG